MKTSGWCPVHDRVYEAKDGLCPECGTPLVAVAGQKGEPGPIRPEPDVELGAAEPLPEPAERVSEPSASDEPVWMSSGVLATIATSIIVVAFLSGLALAHVTRARRPAPDKTPLAAADITVGSTRVGGAIGLRLDSFTQRGATVILRVSVSKDAPIDVGLIEGVSVAFSSAHVELARVLLPTRATPSGFIADGGIPDLATKPITEVRIGSMTVGLVGRSGAGASGGTMALDLSDVWPVTPEVVPRAKHVGRSIGLDDGRSLRLDALVGWPDRLEARLEVRGQRFNWDYNESYQIVSRDFSPIGGKIQPEGVPAGVRYVDFFGLPPRAHSGSLQVSVSDVTITGDWDWDLSP